MNRLSHLEISETFQETQPIPLFDFEQNQETKKDMQAPLGAVATEQALSQTPYQPLSIETTRLLQQASATNYREASEERTSAWEDIGYKRPEERPQPQGMLLSESIASYQSWHRDVRIGVEQFGLTELTDASFEKHLSKSQQHTYLLQLYGYRERIKTQRRLIYEAEGSTRANPDLKDIYGEHSPEEFLTYAGQLTTLIGELEDTPMIAKMHQVFPIPENTHPSRRADLRRSYLAEESKTRKRHGAVSIAFGPNNTPKLISKRK